MIPRPPRSTRVRSSAASDVYKRQIGKRLNGPFFSFKAYDYGPFDQKVYQVIEDQEREGKAQIDLTAGGGRSRYAATVSGFQEGKDILAQMGNSERAYIEKASAWVRKLSFPELVSAIY